MTTSTYYLSVEEALELHRMLIEQFGGSLGVRDLGLVESAVHRPQSGYYETLSLQAAALLQSFALNHAFIDGNKRIAFAAAAVFLKVNGFRLEITAADGETFMIQKVIQGKFDLETLAEWLESCMRPIK
ncbi:type II toxin-antitoxin system death-on-curing family toxin [Bdellovibrionota bacterium FG-2]